jgi:hypothetical protein
MKCSPQAHVFSAWSSASGTIWEVMEAIGGEEVGHWGCAIEGYTWSPVSFSASCLPLGE